MSFMIYDDAGNAFDHFTSRVAAYAALRKNPDCVLMEYHGDNAADIKRAWTVDELPPFTTELTHSPIDARLA